MCNTIKNVLKGIDPDSSTPFFHNHPTKYYTIENLPNDFGLNPHNNLSILFLNARSLLPKLNDINSLISNINNLKIISITETWLDDNTSKLAILDDFNFECCNRDNKSGGGAGIFLNKGIKYKIRQDLCKKKPCF